MRKRFGLAVVGLAIVFGVASRVSSHARESQLLPVPSTLPKKPILANPNQAKDTNFSTKEAFVNPSINPYLALQFDSLRVTRQASDSQLYNQIPSQDIPQTKDRERFQRVMEYAISQKLDQRPMGEITQAIAQQFLGAAYKSDLLDQSQAETLVVNLNQFDCVLFVETVLAIARGVAVQDYSYSTFVNHLRDQRYWNGQINGYCSRLHYFSDWIGDNQKRGTIQNIGQNIGAVSLKKTLNFMTMHRQSYPPMASDNITYQCMVERESQLDDVTIDYISTPKIRSVYQQLQPGDIIALATKIPGLDVTHTGFVYQQPNGNKGFIHASPAGQVTIARDLQTYVSQVKNAIGILVVRPLDPR